MLEFPMTDKHWTIIGGNAEFFIHKSARAVKSSNGAPFNIMLKDHDFSTGTIEFDVELVGQGFPGIYFHIDKDTINSEIFYLRYFGKPNAKRRTSVQYAAVVDGVNLWDLTDDYQAAANILERQWNHIKMVISEKQMKVYVNDMNKAALHVPVLEGVTKKGGISLSGNVIYTNMVIKPNVTEDLPSVAGYDPTYNDSRYLRNWQITEPLELPFGTDLFKGINRNPGVTINENFLDSTTQWKPLKAKHRAMINLTNVYGRTESGQRKLVWLKTSISSEKIQKKRLDLGFSDEVWVFINGQPLFMDKNYYGSPGMKEPRGRCTIENTSIQIPLQEGENEILVGLTNYFFGWGLVARLENTDGVDFQ